MTSLCMQSMTSKISIAVGIALTLGACSGSDSSPVVEVPPPTSAPTVNQAITFTGPLIQAGATEVTRYLKNGVYASTLYDAMREDNMMPTVTMAPALSVSDTNTQVQGVDEADRVEYDGKFLYVSTFPEWIDNQQTPATIRILARQEDFSLAQVKTLSLPDNGRELDGIYLGNNRLAALGASSPMYPLGMITIQPWFGDDNNIDVTIFDTTDPVMSSQVASIQIDGWLLGSRRINDDLYIVSSYVPSIDTLIPGQQSTEVLLKNYLTIQATPIQALMPSVTIDGAKAPLNAAEDCYIPAQATEKDGYAQLLNITRINMQVPTDVQSTCVSVKAFMMYMSAENLYLAGEADNDTIFHKIQLSDLSYQATGKVEGVIGWRGSPNLRVDEREGYLRVVSSDYRQEDPEHKLSVLSQQGTELVKVAELPNATQPEPIGKPGEDVFAVRFFEDKAYIVTFEQIDPLYVIDTSNPTQPRVEGELEIPGFSSYLHPLQNDYLLGVGQEVKVQTADPENTDPNVRPVVTSTGMKVSLFDITDPQQPKEVTAIVRENTYTPVEFDYRAFSFTNDNGRYRFTLP